MNNPAFQPLVLASASPRRRELLDQIGVWHEVAPVAIDETPVEGEAPDLYVLRMAREKALMCQQHWHDTDRLFLGADTTLVVDGRIMGKPDSGAEARAMLARLSGREHQVMSGVALAGPRAVRERVVSSRVRLRPLATSEIDNYVATGEPLDKAGAFGVQGRGAALVAELTGSYTAVVGLPLEAVTDLLYQVDQPVHHWWVAADE
ncbi:Maf family protein [Salicola sp. Rm-C-2C1-2]|uniref:Maf family protein n=1 Tax=Salicola sp. Rm-C-2C1-2 TaxID=3141321 RepID=UPI0032E36FC4